MWIYIYWYRTIICLTNQTQVWFKFTSAKGHQDISKKPIIRVPLSLELMLTQNQFKYNKFVMMHNTAVYFCIHRNLLRNI